MVNLENIKKSSEENMCPGLLVNIIYWPFYLVIMILNTFRENLMWWVVAVLIFFVFCGFIGLLSGLLFIAFRAFKIYDLRFDLKSGEKKK